MKVEEFVATVELALIPFMDRVTEPDVDGMGMSEPFNEQFAVEVDEVKLLYE